MTRHSHTAFAEALSLSDLAQRSLDEIIAHEAARRFNEASTLADRLDAIDFGRDQMREASERAERVTERVLPKVSAPNGFFETANFVAAAQHMHRRTQLCKAIRSRLLAKIVDRDALLGSDSDFLRDERSAWGMGA